MSTEISLHGYKSYYGEAQVWSEEFNIELRADDLIYKILR